MNLAAWAPALITLCGTLITLGMLLQRQGEHSKRLDIVDTTLKDHSTHLGRVDVALVKLESYQAGWADALKLFAEKERS